MKLMLPSPTPTPPHTSPLGARSFGGTLGGMGGRGVMVCTSDGLEVVVDNCFEVRRQVS